MLDPLHHREWLDFRHIIFRVSTIIASCSVVANLLPNCRILKRHPHLQQVYEVVIFLIAAIALNWRAHLPSLDAPFLGFKSVEEDMPLQHVRAGWRRRRIRRQVLR